MKVVVCRVEDLPPGTRKIVKAGVALDRRVQRRRRVLRHPQPLSASGRAAVRRAPVELGGCQGPGEVKMEGPPRLIACPWHGWEYDLETGQSFMGPGETRVKAYGVTVASGATLGEDVKHVEEQVYRRGTRRGT